MLNIILSDPNLSLVNPSILLKAYEAGDKSLVDKIVSHPNSKDLQSLFRAAESNHDFDIISRLIRDNKINSNAMLRTALSMLQDSRFGDAEKEFYSEALHRDNGSG